ncbi:MAG: DMT family transporter [Flavobacteriales bacterium]
MRLTGIHYIILSTLSFSVVNLLVKLLPHIPVNELVFFRSIISLAICAFLVKKLRIPFWGNNKQWLLIRGLFGAAGLTLFFYTIKNMPIASATTLQYLSPVFTVVIAMFLLKERVEPFRWLFFLLAFLGVILIKGIDEKIETSTVIIGVLSAALSGVAYNAIIKCRNTDHPLTIVMYFPLIATPIMGVWCLFQWVMPIGTDWVLLLVIGIFTQIAQVFMTKALHSDKSSRIVPFKYLGSIYALLYGYFIFFEELSILNLIGIAVILVSVVSNAMIKYKI